MQRTNTKPKHRAVVRLGRDVVPSVARDVHPGQELRSLETLPTWKPFLDSYPNAMLAEMVFTSVEEAHKAISLLWKDQLRDCPYTITPDAGIIVPRAALPLFRDAKLNFSLV